MTHKILVIKNEEGLSSQPAAKFVDTASRFSSVITIETGNKKINAKSIMGLLSLNVKKGGKIHVFAVGDDEQEALAKLDKLVENEFADERHWKKD